MESIRPYLEEVEKIITNDNYIESQDPEIASKFIEYASRVGDPLNVYDYMDEFAIAVKIPAYWLGKAEVYRQMGKYLTAIEVLEQGITKIQQEGDPVLCKSYKRELNDMIDQIVGEDLLPQLKQYSNSAASSGENNSARKKLLLQKHQLIKPQKQILIIESIDKDSAHVELVQRPKGNNNRARMMAEVYEKLYGEKAAEKEKAFTQKSLNKPLSWLSNKKLISEVFKMMKIGPLVVDTDKDNHNPPGERTPMRTVGGTKLSRTVTEDSVELVKKKKKKNQNRLVKETHSVEDSDEEGEAEYTNTQTNVQEICMNSTPLAQSMHQRSNHGNIGSSKSCLSMTNPPQKLENSKKVKFFGSTLREKDVRKSSTPKFSNISVDKDSSFQKKLESLDLVGFGNEKNMQENRKGQQHEQNKQRNDEKTGHNIE